MSPDGEYMTGDDFMTLLLSETIDGMGAMRYEKPKYVPKPSGYGCWWRYLSIPWIYVGHHGSEVELVGQVVTYTGNDQPIDDYNRVLLYLKKPHLVRKTLEVIDIVV